MCDSNLASLLMDVGEKKEAAEIAKEGVRLKPDSPHAYARPRAARPCAAESACAAEMAHSCSALRGY